MKKNIIKTILIIATCLTGMISPVYMMSAYAEESMPAEEYNIDYYTHDVIVKKYRMHNGKLQYRRWNETKSKWVDPKWIYVK
ncbi:MAG: hypothetical protein LKI32_01235 [Lachnospiraceae bacterium]|jgi:hypothetical protein|nr:hypothetical protein [Lachnospiraceae bacterium]MCI1656168.1 hypothetical protein [Lachnospiraceae bacterium]MCI2194650.1 hypothetical protein [Lachnospiraceae bacterium]